MGLTDATDFIADSFVDISVQDARLMPPEMTVEQVTIHFVEPDLHIRADDFTKNPVAAAKVARTNFQWH
jgi:hypothetical protein